MATLEEHETAMAEVAEAIEKHEQDKSNYEETVKKYQEGIAFLLSFQEQQARIHPNVSICLLKKTNLRITVWYNRLN